MLRFENLPGHLREEEVYTLLATVGELEGVWGLQWRHTGKVVP